MTLIADSLQFDELIRDRRYRIVCRDGEVRRGKFEGFVHSPKLWMLKLRERPSRVRLIPTFKLTCILQDTGLDAGAGMDRETSPQ